GCAPGVRAVRQAGVGGPLGESPLVASVGINQKELNGCAAPAIRDRSHVQRQGLRDAGRPHERPPENLRQGYMKDISLVLKCNKNCAPRRVTKGLRTLSGIITSSQTLAQ